MNIKNSAPMLFVENMKEKHPGFFNYLEVKNRSNAATWLKEGCYCPVEVASRYIYDKEGVSNPKQALGEGAILATVSAWRKDKSIYDFDADLLEALHDQSKDSIEVTSDMVKLPNWCVYLSFNGTDVDGVFVTFNIQRGKKMLQMCPVFDDGKHTIMESPVSLVLPDEPKSMGTIIDDTYGEIYNHWYLTGHMPKSKLEFELKEKKSLTKIVLNAIFYITAVNGDVVYVNKDKVKKQDKITDKPTEVSYFRVGKEVALRIRKFHQIRERYLKDPSANGHHASPAMHIRRAHWHTYLYGKGKTERRLKWQLPIVVNNNGEEITTTTVTKVEKEAHT